jgi:hypothetical protein
VRIELTDGTTIAADQYTIRGDQAQITLPSGELLQAPAKSIRNVRIQNGSKILADQFFQIINKKFDNDVLIIRNGDNLDYHQGVIGEVNSDTVQFKLDGENLPIKRSKIYGFAYRHPTSEKPPVSLCTVTDVFGSHWIASRISLDKTLQIITPVGLTYSCAPENVAQIDFSQGKNVYLSDMKPESIAWTPFFGTSKTLPSMAQFYAPRLDRNYESNPLKLAGTEYDKGLAIRSRTEIVYRLPGDFSRFKTIAGIDDSVRPQGNVQLVIRGDNKVLLDSSITGTDQPKTIDLDLTGVRKLSILVDFGSKLGLGDHLDLCNARITK